MGPLVSLGDYPDRIRIEQRVAAGKAANGEDIFAWALISLRWSKYTPLRGKELIAAHQQQAETVASFKMHYTSTIVPEMRIVFRGALYDIESVIDIGGAREELELLCKKGLVDG